MDLIFAGHDSTPITASLAALGGGVAIYAGLRLLSFRSHYGRDAVAEAMLPLTVGLVIFSVALWMIFT